MSEQPEPYTIPTIFMSQTAWRVNNGQWEQINNPIEDGGELWDSLREYYYEETSWKIGQDSIFRATVHEARSREAHRPQRAPAPSPYVIVFDYDIHNSDTCLVFVDSFPSLLQTLSMLGAISSSLMLVGSEMTTVFKQAHEWQQQKDEAWQQLNDALTES